MSNLEQFFRRIFSENEEIKSITFISGTSDIVNGKVSVRGTGITMDEDYPVPVNEGILYTYGDIKVVVCTS